MPYHESNRHIKVTWGENSFNSKKAPFGRPVPVPPFTSHFTWQELGECLQEFATIPRRKDSKESDTPWVAPMILKHPADGHKKTNVAGMSNWIAGDLDAPGWTMERISNMFADYEYIAHTTTNSTPQHQRWRIITVLDRAITTEEYGGVWDFVNALCNNELDIRTRNFNRIYYVAAQWIGADNHFDRSWPGQAFPVDAILRDYPPVPLAKPPVATTALAGVHAAPPDDPIITGRMIDKALGQPVGRRLYNIMCEAAACHKRDGIPLDSSTLAAAALLASAIISPGKKRPNLLAEATHALSWANANISYQTPWQQLQKRLRYSLSHSRKKLA